MAFKKNTPFEDRSEKELLVAQTKLLELTAIGMQSVKTNVQILTWVTIIGIIAGVISVFSIV